MKKEKKKKGDSAFSLHLLFIIIIIYWHNLEVQLQAYPWGSSSLKIQIYYNDTRAKRVFNSFIKNKQKKFDLFKLRKINVRLSKSATKLQHAIIQETKLFHI